MPILKTPRFCSGFKKGMTLAEMLVAIGIFSMGIGGFTVLFAKSWQANSFIIEEGAAMTQATEAVNKIARELRGVRKSEIGSYMIASAADTELVVYFDNDGDEEAERVRYFLDGAGKQMKKGVAKYNGVSYPAGYAADEVTVLAEHVMNQSGTSPVFGYYNNKNEKISAPVMPIKVKIIEINLWINIKPLSAPENVMIGTSVKPRNIDGI